MCVSLGKKAPVVWLFSYLTVCMSLIKDTIELGSWNIKNPLNKHFATLVLFQIGCTGMATFFLVDGKMFGCGYNKDSRLGVGHNKEVTVPTLVNTEGHK